MVQRGIQHRIGTNASGILEMGCPHDHGDLHREVSVKGQMKSFF